MTLEGLRGRVALISGAGQGIGRAIAERLSSEGVHVCVNDLDAGRAEAVARATGGTALAFDVGDACLVDQHVSWIEQTIGPVDLLVANHAYMTMAPFADQAEGELGRHLATNLMGTAFLLERCAPAMADRGYGRIVAIASEWGVIGWPNASAYAASKGGIIALVKSAARGVTARGVAVNAVAPGTVDTPQLDVDARDAGLTHEEMVALYAREAPLGRIGLPTDVAATVAFLLSTPAITLVGQVLGPNGGATRV